MGHWIYNFENSTDNLADTREASDHAVAVTCNKYNITSFAFAIAITIAYTNYYY